MLLSKLQIAGVLSRNNDREARATCARFPWISDDLMHILANDKHSHVRRALAYNSNTPLEILRKLENDVAPHVRDAAAFMLANRELNKEGSSGRDPQAMPEPWIPAGMPADQIEFFAKASVGGLSEGEAEQLLDLGDEWVRAYVAFPDFSFWGQLREPEPFLFGSSILERLLRDESGLVRAALARNPHIPEGFYRVLAVDKDRRVLEMLGENPKTPADILESLAREGHWRLLVSITKNDSVPLH